MNRDDLIRKMSTYYDRRAPWHDEYMNFQSQEDHETMMRPLIDRFADKIAGRDVLEVACGTGIWTQTLAARALSVVATDVNDSVIELARSRDYGAAKVMFEAVDAYSLDKLEDIFDVAFMTDWWSHIPKQRVAAFIQVLHSCLMEKAGVIIVDMLWREAFAQEEVRSDADGNRIGRRILPDGSTHWVVKNFPDEDELRERLSPYADDIEYIRDDELERWMVMYKTKG